MRTFLLFLVLLCFSCGGSLSSEQRKKIRANMEAKSMKKISDADLTEAAFAYARNITNIVERKQLPDQNFLDSLQKIYDVQILFMSPGDSHLRSVERQVLEAYTSSMAVDENLQKMGNDSLLYTKPILMKDQNGKPMFTKTLALRIHKKAVILSIKN